MAAEDSAPHVPSIGQAPYRELSASSLALTSMVSVTEPGSQSGARQEPRWLIQHAAHPSCMSGRLTSKGALGRPLQPQLRCSARNLTSAGTSSASEGNLSLASPLAGTVASASAGAGAGAGAAAGAAKESSRTFFTRSRLRPGSGTVSPSGLQPLKPLGRHMPRASVAALAGAAAVAVSLAALSWGEEDIPRHTRQVHDFDPTDPKNHELSQDTQTSGSAPVGVVERVTSSARGVPKKLSRAMGVASQSASEASVDMRRALAACETLAWCLANPGLRKGMEASLGESLTLQLPQFVVDQFPKGGSRTGERGEAGDAAGELGIEAVREKVATRRLRSYSWRQRVARTVRAFTDSPETRAAVAGAGGGRVVQWLMGCLTDPDWVVKREAETAVATLLADGGTRKRTVDAEGSIGHLLAWAVQLDDSSSQGASAAKQRPFPLSHPLVNSLMEMLADDGSLLGGSSEGPVLGEQSQGQGRGQGAEGDGGYWRRLSWLRRGATSASHPRADVAVSDADVVAALQVLLKGEPDSAHGPRDSGRAGGVPGRSGLDGIGMTVLGTTAVVNASLGAGTTQVANQLWEDAFSALLALEEALLGPHWEANSGPVSGVSTVSREARQALSWGPASVFSSPGPHNGTGTTTEDQSLFQSLYKAGADQGNPLPLPAGKSSGKQQQGAWVPGNSGQLQKVPVGNGFEDEEEGSSEGPGKRAPLHQEGLWDDLPGHAVAVLLAAWALDRWTVESEAIDTDTSRRRIARLDPEGDALACGAVAPEQMVRLHVARVIGRLASLAGTLEEGPSPGRWELPGVWEQVRVREGVGAVLGPKTKEGDTSLRGVLSSQRRQSEGVDSGAGGDRAESGGAAGEGGGKGPVALLRRAPQSQPPRTVVSQVAARRWCAALLDSSLDAARGGDALSAVEALASVRALVDSAPPSAGLRDVVAHAGLPRFRALTQSLSLGVPAGDEGGGDMNRDLAGTLKQAWASEGSRNAQGLASLGPLIVLPETIPPQPRSTRTTQALDKALAALLASVVSESEDNETGALGEGTSRRRGLWKRALYCGSDMQRAEHSALSNERFPGGAQEGLAEVVQWAPQLLQWAWGASLGGSVTGGEAAQEDASLALVGLLQALAEGADMSSDVDINANGGNAKSTAGKSAAAWADSLAAAWLCFAVSSLASQRGAPEAQPSPAGGDKGAGGLKQGYLQPQSQPQSQSQSQRQSQSQATAPVPKQSQPQSKEEDPKKGQGHAKVQGQQEPAAASSILNWELSLFGAKKPPITEATTSSSAPGGAGTGSSLGAGGTSTGAKSEGEKRSSRDEPKKREELSPAQQRRREVAVKAAEAGKELERVLRGLKEAQERGWEDLEEEAVQRGEEEGEGTVHRGGAQGNVWHGDQGKGSWDQRNTDTRTNFTTTTNTTHYGSSNSNTNNNTNNNTTTNSTTDKKQGVLAQASSGTPAESPAPTQSLAQLWAVLYATRTPSPGPDSDHPGHTSPQKRSGAQGSGEAHERGGVQGRKVGSGGASVQGGAPKGGAAVVPSWEKKPLMDVLGVEGAVISHVGGDNDEEGATSAGADVAPPPGEDELARAARFAVKALAELLSEDRQAREGCIRAGGVAFLKHILLRGDLFPLVLHDAALQPPGSRPAMGAMPGNTHSPGTEGHTLEGMETPVHKPAPGAGAGAGAVGGPKAGSGTGAGGGMGYIAGAVAGSVARVLTGPGTGTGTGRGGKEGGGEGRNGEGGEKAVAGETEEDGAPLASIEEHLSGLQRSALRALSLLTVYREAARELGGDPVLARWLEECTEGRHGCASMKSKTHAVKSLLHASASASARTQPQPQSQSHPTPPNPEPSHISRPMQSHPSPSPSTDTNSGFKPGSDPGPGVGTPLVYPRYEDGIFFFSPPRDLLGRPGGAPGARQRWPGTGLTKEQRLEMALDSASAERHQEEAGMLPVPRFPGYAESVPVSTEGGSPGYTKSVQGSAGGGLSEYAGGTMERVWSLLFAGTGTGRGTMGREGEGEGGGGGKGLLAAPGASSAAGDTPGAHAGPLSGVLVKGRESRGRSYDLPPGVDPKVDIVFVHGILGGPYKSWRQDILAGAAGAGQPGKGAKDKGAKDPSSNSQGLIGRLLGYWVFGRPLPEQDITSNTVRTLRGDELGRTRQSQSSGVGGEASGPSREAAGGDVPGVPGVSGTPATPGAPGQARGAGAGGLGAGAGWPEEGQGGGEDGGGLGEKVRDVLRRREEEGLDDTCWPLQWLARDLPGSRLISTKYKTNLTEWLGSTLPVHGVAGELLPKLAAAGVGDRPVIFVTHSMGGLIVKELIASALDSTDPQLRKLATNTRGIVFYSVPHFGSKLADLPWGIGWGLLRPSPSVDDLKTTAPRLVGLNQRIRALHRTGQVQVLNFAETKVTPVVETYGGLKIWLEVVPLESAYPGYGDIVVLDGTDHVNACKPLNPSDPAYTETVAFLRKLCAQFDQGKR